METKQQFFIKYFVNFCFIPKLCLKISEKQTIFCEWVKYRYKGLSEGVKTPLLPQIFCEIFLYYQVILKKYESRQTIFCECVTYRYKGLSDGDKTTILHQIFCELLLYSQVMFKNIREADDIL